MKLTTIWTIPAMSFRERLNRTGEWMTVKIAKHLPRRVRYWSFILEGGKYIESNEIVPEVRYTDLLKRMEPTGKNVGGE